MIEHEDMPTTPRPISHDTEDSQGSGSATIQVPALPSEQGNDDTVTIGNTDNTDDTNASPTAQTTSTATTTPSASSSTPAPTPASPPAPAASPNPFMSVEDLLKIQLVSDPQLSPDGTTIAFVVLQCHEKTNSTSSAIWLVNSQGGKTATPRQITDGVHHDFAPRWSPDGKTLAFLSNRDGTPQMYLLPLDGGEARRIGMFAQGISEYSWRPDGGTLLVHSAWKPLDDRQQTDTSSIAIVYTRLMEQWDGMGYRAGRMQQLWLLSLEGTTQRITSEPVDLIQSCWSPDGSEIAFCANRRPDPDLSVSMALWVLTLATGQMRRLTPEDGLAQMPAWSPDGQYIAFYYNVDQTEARNYSPWIVNAHSNEAPRPATPETQKLNCQQWVIDELRTEFFSSPQWYPDSHSLLITVQERGQVHIYRVNTANDQVTRLTAGNGRYLDPKLSKDGQTITCVRADWFTPGDIWSMDGQGGQGKNLRKLTGVNDALLRSRQLTRPRRITWQSFDGQEIEGWLYLPPLAEQQKAPLILEVHGGPTLAWGDAYVHEFQVLAGQGFAVLAPNPRGSAGYGEDFCVSVINDWGGNDFRDLMTGLDHVIATEPIDGGRLGIGGISYGGFMTNWAITQTNRFKAAVSRNGISNLITSGLLTDQVLWFDMVMEGNGQNPEAFKRSRSPLTFADRITTPLLLLHAEQDMRCPIEESVQLFVALRKRKQPVELVRYPNMSHLMDLPIFGTPLQRADRIRRTVGWFKHYV